MKKDFGSGILRIFQSKGCMNFKIIVLIIISLSVTVNLNSSHKSYQWKYKGKDYKLSLNLSDGLYKYYKTRTRIRDSDLFVTDSLDDLIITKLIKDFRFFCMQNSINEKELPYLLFAFIQNFDYVDDLSSTSHLEYPKFPYETLYDGAGDCEDTSFLLAALLRELNYDTILITMEHHMAIGICGNNLTGYFVSYNDKKYYYLETTSKNWEVGCLPTDYKKEKVTILPLRKRPSFKIDCDYSYKYNSYFSILHLNTQIVNVGSIDISNVVIEIILINRDNNIVSKKRSQPMFMKQEEKINYSPEKITFKTELELKIIVNVLNEGKVVDRLSGEWIKFQ